MSFQDVGRPSTRPGAAKPQNSAAISSSRSEVSAMSESILQYQRNVGILEKIVQSLLSRNGVSNSELEAQFSAQTDVIEQLERKIKQELTRKASASGAEKTTWIKLQRDFERVQTRATSLQETATRMRQQAAKLKAVEDEQAQASHDPQASFEYQQRLQLEQDRLNEAIMREREEEIRKINQGMHQVNEIYKDLAHIVGSQQEQIDSIETQMEDSRANAESGLGQIQKANEKFGASNCVIS